MSDQQQPADAGGPRIRITRAEVGERFETVPYDLVRGRGDYAGLSVDERARLAGFVEVVTAPELDDASAAAAGEAYAQRHQRADLKPGDFERMQAGIVDAARAGGPGGVPRWKLRKAVLPTGATGPFFVALVGALEAGDIERVPGDVPGSRYRVPQRPARPAGLPTPAETIAAAETKLDEAYRALGDAGDELRSDWRPGTSMTDEQAGRRARMQQAITKAKAAINGARQ